ncbi:MAG: 50S ribosomal protein L11 methyltransferase [Armatimonadaceae bacterium]
MPEMQKRWAEIEIAVSGDAQEWVGAVLVDTVGCQGYATTAHAVTGYLPVDDRLENSLLTLRNALHDIPDLPAASRELTIRFVNEEDWANAWKEFFKPQRIGKRLVIKPTWEEYAPEPDDLILLLDPGMAFGTGHHSTTRLCLTALEDYVTPDMSIADVGTGSGILAVGAVLLGAARVEATDNDPLAVRIAEENIATNGMNDRIMVREASLPPAGEFDIVVANILADVILSMAKDLYTATRPDGMLIASGIIDHRAEDVRQGLVSVGYTIAETRTEGDWVAVLAQRKI